MSHSWTSVWEDIAALPILSWRGFPLPHRDANRLLRRMKQRIPSAHRSGLRLFDGQLIQVETEPLMDHAIIWIRKLAGHEN